MAIVNPEVSKGGAGIGALLRTAREEEEEALARVGKPKAAPTSPLRQLVRTTLLGQLPRGVAPVLRVKPEPEVVAPAAPAAGVEPQIPAAPVAQAIRPGPPTFAQPPVGIGAETAVQGAPAREAMPLTEAAPSEGTPRGISRTPRGVSGRGQVKGVSSGRVETRGPASIPYGMSTPQGPVIFTRRKGVGTPHTIGQGPLATPTPAPVQQMPFQQRKKIDWRWLAWLPSWLQPRGIA